MEDAAEGKAAAKAALRQRVGLSAADAPLVAVVTRLTHQKGIHLIKHAAWRTLERGAQFLLLGSAPDPRVQVCIGLWRSRLPSCCFHAARLTIPHSIALMQRGSCAFPIQRPPCSAALMLRPPAASMQRGSHAVPFRGASMQPSFLAMHASMHALLQPRTGPSQS